MSVIEPCHWCGRAVYSDTPALFLHDVCCTKPECQEQKRDADERMQAALERAERERNS